MTLGFIIIVVITIIITIITIIIAIIITIVIFVNLAAYRTIIQDDLGLKLIWRLRVHFNSIVSLNLDRFGKFVFLIAPGHRVFTIVYDPLPGAVTQQAEKF